MTPVGWHPILRGLAIAGCGAVMVGAFVIALSCAYVARWDVVAIALVVGAMAGVVFRRSFTPFVQEFDWQPARSPVDDGGQESSRQNSLARAGPCQVLLSVTDTSVDEA